MAAARRAARQTPVNPWVADPRVDEPARTPAAPASGDAGPPRPRRQAIAASGERVLMRRTLSSEQLVACSLWVVGVHGGAGTSSLASLIGAGDGERSWQCPPAGDRHTRVLLCARAHLDGLQRMQAALREWASGEVPGVELEGVALVAAAPKLPGALKELVTRVEAAASGAVWHVGWHPRWLVGQPVIEKDRGLQLLVNRLSNEKGRS